MNFNNKVFMHSLRPSSDRWLVTGAAGFIGSNLLQTLLLHDQYVVGLDNFETGYQANLDEVKSIVTEDQWSRFTFISGDIRNIEDCRLACAGVTYVLHQAALGSVPRSILNPIATNQTNIDGFLNMLVAANDAQVSRFVYAASSSTYGDHKALPKREDQIGNPLSPYAVTKYVNELYAQVFSKNYGLESIGLRYFNVFGPRQDPNGSYAAVIPRWIQSFLNDQPILINGDGETSRDFCYINNVVQANILAATTKSTEAVNHVFNIAVGEQTSLNNLFQQIKFNLSSYCPCNINLNPTYKGFRAGDVRHSLADITKATNLLGYHPSHNIERGLKETVQWYLQRKDT